MMLVSILASSADIHSDSCGLTAQIIIPFSWHIISLIDGLYIVHRRINWQIPTQGGLSHCIERNNTDLVVSIIEDHLTLLHWRTGKSNNRSRECGWINHLWRYRRGSQGCFCDIQHTLRKSNPYWLRLAGHKIGVALVSSHHILTDG